MSVQEQGLQLVTAKSLGTRPTISIKSVTMAAGKFMVKVIIGDRYMRAWAKVERVAWYQGQEHGPVVPRWYGGLW